ncbi:MAG: hypothetical protein WCJ40_08285 [Planctomycetota bacterium]|nr:hypothetical protein [Planctomycetota bacterium]
MIVASKLQRSLVEATHDEVELHKWIESEKAGRDLGEKAIHDWLAHYWDRFLRQRWVEHLQGQVFWHELDHTDFGLFQRGFCGNPLADKIIGLYKAGGKNGENLGIVQRARREDWPIEEVFQILETLDINSRRLVCQVEERLIIANSYF